MMGFEQLARPGRVVSALASVALLALAVGCGGGEGEPAASQPAAGIEVSKMAKGQREVSLPGDVTGRVAAGELPEGFPTDVPTPPNSEPGYALVFPEQGSLATFESEDSTEELRSYFEAEFPKQGWNVDDGTNLADVVTISASKGARKARVIIRKAASSTEVAITLTGS